MRGNGKPLPQGLNEYMLFLEMSQGNSQKTKFQNYPNNHLRGHTEFGQPAYPQQYAFATQMQVQNNSTHDMNKQVQAQQGMYAANSSGIPGANQQHHQPGMGGPAPSPQPSSLVPQGQQLSRHLPNMAPSYFRSGPNGPRSLPAMNRNSMTNVVNQTTQQPTQQYGQIHLLNPPFHPQMSQPMVMATHQLTAAQMFPRPQYSQQQQYPMITPQHVHYVPHWNTYNQAQNTNGYYQAHMQPSYAPISTHTIPTPAQPPKADKKVMPIIDPSTGRDILKDFKKSLELNSEPEKEETGDGAISVGCQFAAQVAAAAIEGKREPLSKSSSIEDRVNIDSQPPMVLCPNEMSPTEPVEEPSEDKINDTEEQYNIDGNIPCTEQSLSFYNKEVELSSTSDNFVYEVEPQQDSFEPISVVEPEVSEDYNSITDNLIGYSDDSVVIPSGVQVLDMTPVPDSEKDLDLGRNYEEVETEAQQMLPEVIDDVDTNIPEVLEQLPISSVQMLAQEITPLPIEDVTEELPTPSVTILKPEEKPSSETKKNKARRKKDFSKRSEGGELDAFYVKEEVQVVETTLPPPPPVPTAPDASPSTTEETLPSPVTIMDTEILKSIPLPDEVVAPQLNDASPVEPLSESSLSPCAENEDKENIVEDTTSKSILKYSYKEDQWSPLNPEGKKQYDRDFLLHLQSQPMSMRKPTNLPNLDVIKDKAHIQRLNEANRAPVNIPVPMRYADPFMPMFARGNSGGAGLRPPHPMAMGGRRSQQGRDKPKKVISFSSSLNQAVKLHEAEHAWKPPAKKVESAEDADDQELYRKVRGILNKLTPQKFQTLVEQVKNLEINTEDRLNKVIDLVFEKAIDEPNFSVPYANMCKQVAKIQVAATDQPGQFVNFRKLLLTKCQKEFEQDRCDELKREEQMKIIKSADAEVKRKLQMEFDEEEKKTRYRQLGNIRFIGELFKLKMLIEPIMYACIDKLLEQGDEESLECLCKLLKTIGKELEESKNEPKERKMEMCFVRMQNKVERRQTSSRVRFMLQDVIDLRKNNWIPRRDENNPKTIDQIHEDAKREANEQQHNLLNSSYSNKRMPDDRDRRKNNMGRASEDGWTIKDTKNTKGSYSVVDPSKLKLTKPAEVESMHLGPGGRGLSSWAKGSSGGTKNTESDPRSLLTNRYSALADQQMSQNYDGRRGAQRSAASSRESSRGRSSQLPPQVRKTPSVSKERESLLETVKSLRQALPTEQKPQEVKKKPDAQVNGKENSETALKGSELPEEEFDRKIKPLIDEFVHNCDIEEATKCIMELASPNTVHLFISGAVNQVLERSSQARCLLGQLLYSLLEKNLINVAQFEKGFRRVLEFIDDYALDIPMIWDYLGEILEAMLAGPKFSLSVIRDVLTPIMPSLNSGKLMCAVLHCAAKKRGTIKVGDEWRDNSLNWEEFLGSSDVIEDFIKSNKLDFTISQTKVQPKVEFNITEIKKNLDLLLSLSDTDTLIMDWIESNVPADQLSESSFIRALVTAVHENAITGSGGNCELDQNKLIERARLLLRYIDNNVDLQLQALYAVQALVNKLHQPKKILRIIFDMLYDADVITDVAFKNWEESTDPAEQDGKGVALHSLGTFFTWLREVDEESADADDETDGDAD